MTIIDEFFSAEQALCEHFGYQHNWRSFPFDDQRGQPWMIIGPNQETGEGCKVAWTDKKKWAPHLIKAGNNHYSGNIYTYRHLKRWIWRNPDAVLMLVDTRTDGNILLMVFDRALECKDEKLKQLYMDQWGDAL